mmetsp:Transcript_7668/g.18552  ORF Transcript_7668/g.18552 Transcript_7668/m.18552 type:complete len:222 (+) Transcript_7668:4095-4760(+)
MLLLVQLVLLRPTHDAIRLAIRRGGPCSDACGFLTQLVVDPGLWCGTGPQIRNAVPRPVRKTHPNGVVFLVQPTLVLHSANHQMDRVRACGVLCVGFGCAHFEVEPGSAGGLERGVGAVRAHVHVVLPRVVAQRAPLPRDRLAAQVQRLRLGRADDFPAVPAAERGAEEKMPHQHGLGLPVPRQLPALHVGLQRAVAEAGPIRALIFGHDQLGLKQPATGS